MKRLFTLLMLVCTFMCIPQAMKATVYLRGAYGSGNWPSVKSGIEMTQNGSTYTLSYTSTQTGEYRFRFASSGWNDEMCPYATGYDLTQNPSSSAYTISNDCWESPSTANGRYFIVNMKAGTTYVFTVVDGTTKSVACDVKGSSGGDSYAKFYLTGSFNSWSKTDTTYPFTTTDGVNYTCTFTGLAGSPLYFKPRGVAADGSAFGSMLGTASNTNITTDYQNVTYGDGAWMLNAESSKTYTITLKYSTSSYPQIKYSEGSATTAIGFTLLNATSGAEIATSSDGTYTLDLTGDGATDTSVKLTVGDETWMLADATTVTTSGTSTYSFSKTGAAALTFKAGYKYTLKLTDDGTLTVTATAAAQTRILTEGFYLVGNFFDGEGYDKINYDNAIFKFQQQKNDDNGHKVYMLELPATLTAKAQVLGVNSRNIVDAVYGPGEVKAINNSTLAANASVDGQLKKSTTIEEGTNYWNMSTRRTQYEGEGQDGSYQIYITLGDDGVTPKFWKFVHNDFKRIAYFLSTSRNATAMAIASTRKTITDNFNSGKYFGSVYVKEVGAEFYAISNDIACNERIGASDVTLYNNNAIKNSIDRPTYDKLFLFGNSESKGEASYDSHKITPKSGTFTAGLTAGVHVLEFNSNKGNFGLEQYHGGMSAEIQVRNDRETITSISMVGPAIPGTMTEDNEWNWTSTAADMPYDENENCYKLTLSTSVANGVEHFRFVGNHNKDINWFENGTLDTDKAKTSTNPNGHEASADDPNEVAYTEPNHTDKRAESSDYDIIWNRDAGKYTVRFYIYTYTPEGESNPSFRYFYTITENDDLELRDFENITYKGNNRNILYRGKYRYFRAWSDNKAWKAPKGVDVFVVDKYTAADENSNTPASFSLTQIDNVDTYGVKGVIPANTGVILAATDEVQGIYVKTTSPTGYNVMRIPMEEADDNTATCTGIDNKLVPLIYAKNIPSSDANGYNYLFGFYNAHHAFPDDYSDTKDFLLGFWLSNGNGQYHSNACYLPLTNDVVKDLGIGISYQGLGTSAGAKKAPALLFDFAKVNNNTTGINTVANTRVVSSDKYYTLSGVMVEKPTAKGVYIHNGKKYIVK